METTSMLWKKKIIESKNCGLALYAGDRENMWYNDRGFQKHMTGDKDKFMSFNEIKNEDSVIIGNNTLATIKGKWIVL